MADSITDSPTPEEMAETERLAGELLWDGQTEPSPAVQKAMSRFYEKLSEVYGKQRQEARAEIEQLRAEADARDRKHREMAARDLGWYFRLFDVLKVDKESLENRDVTDLILEWVNGLVLENDALRAKVADLSLALAREALLRQEAEREHEIARAELDEIATVCGLAGVGSRGMGYADRVRALSLELGHQIGRADLAERERGAMIATEFCGCGLVWSDVPPDLKVCPQCGAARAAAGLDTPKGETS